MTTIIKYIYTKTNYYIFAAKRALRSKACGIVLLTNQPPSTYISKQNKLLKSNVWEKHESEVF